MFQECMDELKQIPHYFEAVQVAKLNTEGELYLAGDILTHFLAKEFYGAPDVPAQYHFFADKICERQRLLEDWRTYSPSINMPDTNIPDHYFRDVLNGRYFADDKGSYVTITRIGDLQPILSLGLKPTITNHFKTAALTLDQMAFDIQRDTLWIEPEAKASILDKRININRYTTAAYEALKAQLSLQNYVEARAKSLGFSYGNKT